LSCPKVVPPCVCPCISPKAAAHGPLNSATVELPSSSAAVRRPRRRFSSDGGGLGLLGGECSIS
jgi:hypothetical protein